MALEGFLIDFLTHQSPAAALTVIGILAYYEVRRIKKAVETLNHHSTIVINVLLSKGIITPDDLKNGER